MGKIYTYSTSNKNPEQRWLPVFKNQNTREVQTWELFIWTEQNSVQLFGKYMALTKRQRDRRSFDENTVKISDFPPDWNCCAGLAATRGARAMTGSNGMITSGNRHSAVWPVPVPPLLAQSCHRRREPGDFDVSPLCGISGLSVWSHFSMSPLLYTYLPSPFLLLAHSLDQFSPKPLFSKRLAPLCGSCCFLAVGRWVL